jgi:hypothetical protein
MNRHDDPVAAAKEAFRETIRLKVEQLYRFVPKGVNTKLTGDYVEELVRGFIQAWIAPCVLAHGTLHPADANKDLPPEEQKPKQIDGIVYDPRMGPPVLREGNFIVVDPRFCRGIIEIKASEQDLGGFHKRLQGHSRQYFKPYSYYGDEPTVMGLVIHDPDPAGHSRGRSGGPALYQWWAGQHCPIFILFKESKGKYEHYDQGIDAMMKAIFLHGWQKQGHPQIIRPDLEL